MEAGGFEPTAQNTQQLENKELTEKPNATTAQILPKTSNWGIKNIIESCPELEQIITVWPELPEHIKAAIKSLIESVK